MWKVVKDGLRDGGTPEELGAGKQLVAGATVGEVDARLTAGTVPSVQESD